MNATAKARRKRRQQQRMEQDHKTILALPYQIRTRHHAKIDGKSLRKWKRNHNFQHGERFEVEAATLGFMDANMREHRGTTRITDRKPTWIRKD